MSKFKNLAAANNEIERLNVLLNVAQNDLQEIANQLNNQIELVKSLEEDIKQKDERIESLSKSVYSAYAIRDSAIEQLNQVNEESRKTISDLASAFKVLTDKIK